MPVNESVFERWRPALIAFAILATVIAFGVVTSESNNENSDDVSNPNVVVETSFLPVVTVPLDRSASLLVVAAVATHLRLACLTRAFDQAEQ